MQVGFILLLTIVASTLATMSAGRAEAALNANELVEIAVEANPQIHSMRAQWEAAQHQILQNYAPADPIVSYLHENSDRDFDAGTHAHNIAFSFQPPGMALLQAKQATRTAEIARLTYEAAVRDLRAGVETAYYQVVLDDALIAINEENIANLKQVVHVTQVQYTAGQAQQSDLIGAELALQQAQLQQRQYETSRLNDRAGLNQLLHRKPASPLELESKIELRPLELRLDKAVETATRARQEILEAALAEKNSTDAVTIAKLEYIPSYSFLFEYDMLLEPGNRPENNVHQAYSFNIGFSMPMFFWIHQKEDVLSAQHSLEAARYSIDSVVTQTETTVTQLYQSAQFAYESAKLYRGQLIPLADKEFKVALVAYQSGKVDFLTLSSALQADYGSRLTYLQNANSFFAGEVAVEQAMGVSFLK